MKRLFWVPILLSALLLSACSMPVVELQHFTKPQAKLIPFGNVDIKPFTDLRAKNLQENGDKIPYQEVLKSDNLTSEFLQKSQGVGSSTWYYATDPEVAIFIQNVMAEIGLKSGFISPSSNQHYVIEGVIHNLSITMLQTQNKLVVNVKFTGILRNKNGIMLMIMPIDYNYVTAMAKPLADKSQTAQLTVILDQAITSAIYQMYHMIEVNFPPELKPQAKSGITTISKPINKVQS